MPDSKIVAVGASAGGVEALIALAGALPSDFPAAVVAVLHVSSGARSALPDILDRRGTLRASHATDGELIAGGHIYVAPPDKHLTVTGDRLRVSVGPKENGHRPAIDPLFRSVARSWGRYGAGVVLTGLLSDAAIGLAEIKVAGGLTVIQSDPMFDSMPVHARAMVAPDFDIPLADIAGVLDRWARGPKLAERPLNASGEVDLQKEPSSFTCPECGGTLWPTADPEGGFACRIGHVYGEEALVAAQASRVETALWTAVRSLEERANMLERLGERLSRNSPALAELYSRRLHRLREQQETLATLAVGAIAGLHGDVSPASAPPRLAAYGEEKAVGP